MIQGVNGFVPFGAPESAVRRIDGRGFSAMLDAVTAKTPAEDGLAEILQGSLRLKLLEALSRVPRSAEAPAPPPAAAPPAVDAAPAPPPPAQPDPEAIVLAPPAPKGEEALIQEIAQRTGVDPAFLNALRRAENGRPGREFGVLSIPAPTYENQAQVAAETIRRNAERFERNGGQVVDPGSGRYTEEFIRFFSSRYAPVGAENDPTGLNRYHARNLIRLYGQLAPKA
ncbi:MAG: hypothetical protein HY726_08645 [Candidatus Rokubacteria bacterium]|nr:hypothetical protein [Candidatus Rokubacteria bacterium]